MGETTHTTEHQPLLSQAKMAPAILGTKERPRSPIFLIGQGGILELKSKGQICQHYFLPKQNRKRKIVGDVHSVMEGSGEGFTAAKEGCRMGYMVSSAGGEGGVHVIKDQNAKEGEV